MTLSVDADISAETDLLGKYVTDLQSDVAISNGEITGTLLYVTGYNGFSGKASERKGNYLALHFETEEEGSSIAVELVNGTVGHPVTLDPDGIIILRITNKDTQYLRVVANAEGYTKTVREYHLSGLTLNAS